MTTRSEICKLNDYEVAMVSKLGIQIPLSLKPSEAKILIRNETFKHKFNGLGKPESPFEDRIRFELLGD